MAKKAVIKTQETKVSIKDFVAKLKNEQQRKDTLALVKMMEKISKEKAKVWGTAMIGFGNKVYVSPKTGRQVDWFYFGFAPRSSSLALYLMMDMKKKADALKKLGKHKMSGGCLHIKTLADIDMKVLEGMVAESMKSQK